jgi:hypothetical protein
VPPRTGRVAGDRRTLPVAARTAPGTRPPNPRRCPQPRPCLPANARERGDLEQGSGEPGAAPASIDDDRSNPLRTLHNRPSRSTLLGYRPCRASATTPSSSLRRQVSTTAKTGRENVDAPLAECGWGCQAGGSRLVGAGAVVAARGSSLSLVRGAWAGDMMVDGGSRGRAVSGRPVFCGQRRAGARARHGAFRSRPEALN